MDLFPDFGKSHSIPLLKEVLVRSFADSTSTVWEIYAQITVDTPYTLKNVQTALTELETEGKVWIDPPAAKRLMRKGERTLARDKVVTFLP
jgi:hypothetical protein